MLDFAKAFDKVPHKRLLSKLTSYGITGNTHNWITSFLSNRKQRVSVNGALSDITDVTSGVPQGSVLGPILFLLYINDINENIQSSIRLFADDSIIYGEIRTVETITGVEDEGEIRTEETITGVEDEGEIRTEERKEICSGATLMATHAYTRNPESPIGKEIDLQQWETLVFKGLHAENEHWRLVEDRHGQVGYAPAAFLVVILDTTAGEEENDATKKGQVNSTEENRIGGRIGQEGERRKSYSAAVIDGKKRKDTIYVGDSIMRKTDSRLSRGEDVVVCLPGARIEHVTERVEKIMGRGNGGTILVHVGTNNADKEGTTAIVEKYRDLLKKTKQARVGQIIISGILPVFGNRIQGYRNSKRMAVNGMVERLCKEEDVGYVDLWDSFVGREDMYGRDGLHLSGKGAAVFAEGLSGAVASGLGKVRFLN